MRSGYELACYMVVFLDVLGQSERLEELNRLPTNQAEIDKAARILDETAGSIVGLREEFNSLFDALSQPTPILDSLSPQNRNIAISLRQVKIARRGISDSYIMTLPLVEDKLFGRSGVMLNVWSALCATCSMFVAGLAVGLAIQGGVEIGLGTLLPIDNRDEVYGPAVARAVKLENKVAQYPRVVAGEHLWQYLCSVEGSTVNTKFDQFATKFAVNSKNLICQEQYDGVRILDYLGKEVRSLQVGVEPQMVEKAYQWVIQEHEKYIKSKNYKLAGRYGLLRQYMESRLTLWGINRVH